MFSDLMLDQSADTDSYQEKFGFNLTSMGFGILDLIFSPASALEESRRSNWAYRIGDSLGEGHISYQETDSGRYITTDMIHGTFESDLDSAISEVEEEILG